MPYEGELADKTSHFDIVENPDVAEFIGQCDYLTVPSEQERDEMVRAFTLPPDLSGVRLPDSAIAIDGSRHESAFVDELPSTRVGYVKLTPVLVKLKEYEGLRVGRFVDPFKLARLERGSEALSFVLPSSNVSWNGHSTVRESFRAALDSHLMSEATRFRRSDFRTSLRSTLIQLSHPRGDAGDKQRISISRCPLCEKRDIVLRDVQELQKCPQCNEPIYPSDGLRLWEEVGENHPNVTALTRLMTVLEHLMVAHFIRHFLERGEPKTLARIAFVLDGPMALFGTVAPLHRGIHQYIHQANDVLRRHSEPPLLLMSLVKSGPVVEHAKLMERFVPPGRMLLVNDDYRFSYIKVGDQPGNGFGYETYYGQDFIYRTESGRTFVLELPFPPGAKASSGSPFVTLKSDPSNYPTLARALAFINYFESDLYENAVVPIALAHRHTAISLRPGGEVLDLLAQHGLAEG